MSIKAKFDAVKYLANLIFKKEIKKQKGVMKILPGDKVKAEEKAKFALRKLEERGNINVNNLRKSDFEFIAEDITNPFKYGEKTVVKSADILPFKYKRSFAEELADASKKGDFNRMQGIMKVDPKFKEVMKNVEKQKATEKLIRQRDLQKRPIPLDTIQYQTPEIAKLKGAERMDYLITDKDQTAKLLKKGVTSDDIIYAQDRYGMTAKDIMEASDSGFKFPFAGGGVAGMLGEPTYQDEDHRVPYGGGKFVLESLPAAIRKIMEKFGKKSITTADKIKLPPKKIQQEIMEWNQRQKKKLNTWEDPDKVRAAVDDIFPSGDYKYDAQMASEALVENNPKAFGGKLLDDLDDKTRMKIYGAVVEVVQRDLAKMLQLKKATKPTKTLEGIEKTGTINISDPNVADEFARFMKETDPVGHAKIQKVVDDANQQLELKRFKPPKGEKGHASGGLAGMLGE